jgi:hypothetical protein
MPRGLDWTISGVKCFGFFRWDMNLKQKWSRVKSVEIFRCNEVYDIGATLVVVSFTFLPIFMCHFDN